jgi:uncharacterized integral membrane protein
MPIAIDTIASRQVTRRWLGHAGQIGHVSPGSAPFRAGKGENGSMSSDSSVSPDQPPTASAQDNGAPPESAVKFTRTASVWTSLIAGFLILIVLLIFITQNTDSAQVAFLTWRWTLPLGVQILLAAVGGGLITVLAGTARIYQLRRAAKKNLAAGR